MEKIQEAMAKVMSNKADSEFYKVASSRPIKQEDPNIIEGTIKFLDEDKE